MTVLKSTGPRIVMAAYACDPDEGSEAGAGWALLSAATELASSVTVITRSSNAPRLEELAQGLACPVDVVRIATPFDASGKTYIRYIAWLFLAARYARHRAGEVDVYHHATFASDWMPPAIPRGLKSRATVVWGPAGGNTYPPINLSSKLGTRFLVNELFRKASTCTVRAFTRAFMRGQVDTFIAMNQDSERSAPAGSVLRTHPNCVLDAGEFASYQAGRRRGTRKLLFVGRLLEWKGVLLAVEALDHLADDWTLEVVGDGPLMPLLEELQEKYGPRLVLRGRIPRGQVLERMSAASAVIFPSLHDSAGWTAAEAAACGLPVVCLDLGGPSEMAGKNAVVVAASPGTSLTRRLAAAAMATEEKVYTAQSQWTLNSMVAFLRDVYRIG